MDHKTSPVLGIIPLMFSGVQASINSCPACCTNTGIAYPAGSSEDDQILCPVFGLSAT